MAVSGVDNHGRDPLLQFGLLVTTRRAEILNSVVRAMLIMYVSCVSGLGHTGVQVPRGHIQDPVRAVG